MDRHDGLDGGGSKPYHQGFQEFKEISEKNASIPQDETEKPAYTGESSVLPMGFWNQTEALFIKNLTYQKRHPQSNAWIIMFPFALLVLTSSYQFYSKTNPDPPVPAILPTEMPPLFRIPDNEFRAVKTPDAPFDDLPDASCRKEGGSCPATFLITGSNKTLAESMAMNMYSNTSVQNSSSNVIDLADGVWGIVESTDDSTGEEEMSFYNLESRCPLNSTHILRFKDGNTDSIMEAECLQGLHLWRENKMQINNELLQGYYNGNPKGETNEIVAAYDLLETSTTRFMAHVWFNSTYKGPEAHIEPIISTVWNAYLQFLRGPSLKMVLESVGAMGTPVHANTSDLVSMLAAFFYTWVFLQLFPVIVTSLVYEKQQRLLIMMKMHGLGDGPYWVITYMYFFILGLIYILLLVGCGAISGEAFFSLNNYAIQILFYVIHMNLIIPSAFLLSSLFTNAKTASVMAYIIVFGAWMIGVGLFDGLIGDVSFPRASLVLLELFPGFSLYRGLYEFRAYGLNANKMGTYGMRWRVLSDSSSGIREVLIIMSVEWFFLLILAYYVDKILAIGSGFPKLPFCLLRKSQKSSLSQQDPAPHDSRVPIQSDNQDVHEEKERVKELLRQPHPEYLIISDDLKKMYPSKNGSPEKYAVRGLSLAVSKGECFGLLGPNGAGKTSFFNMMTGLTEPSAGTAYIGGLNLQTEMNKIYECIGVCPQEDLLWESLTGREHLNFYGRLKNLKGPALEQAVEDSLRNVNLLQDAHKPAGRCSGGMKRRLSVAISLIGNPKVVYMDEPATGLDPASKLVLWDCVEKAKKDRAIILTTHSMEEAERLCDRIGIFVAGNLQCIGRPDELKARYGGSYIFTITTSVDNETDVEAMVNRLSPNAEKMYSINGTQKFKVPKDEIKLSDVFKSVNEAKKRFHIQAWEVSEATLEDVFIKVANEAQHPFV